MKNLVLLVTPLLAGWLLSACGGGTTSTPTPVPAAQVLPMQAAGCPVATAVPIACPAPGETPSLAQFNAIIGTYDNGGSTLAQQLFVTPTGDVFYGASSTAYTPSRICLTTAGSSTVVVNFTTPAISRIFFDITATGVTALGNVPTTPATPINNATRSDCRF